MSLIRDAKLIWGCGQWPSEAAAGRFVVRSRETSHLPGRAPPTTDLLPGLLAPFEDLFDAELRQLYLAQIVRQWVGHTERIASERRLLAAKEDYFTQAAAPAAASKEKTMPTSKPIETGQETCANCGRQIGRLEKPCVWEENVVCRACWQVLSADEAGGVPPDLLSQVPLTDREIEAETKGRCEKFVAPPPAPRRSTWALRWALYLSGAVVVAGAWIWQRTNFPYLGYIVMWWGCFAVGLIVIVWAITRISLLVSGSEKEKEAAGKAWGQRKG